jgi:hypothetical protein
MKVNLITLATVKTQLGIGDTTYDTAITAMIPIVSSDVRRILNTEYNKYVTVPITEASADFISGHEFSMGQVLSGTGITDDTYIVSYNAATLTYTMSAVATADATFFYPTVLIAQWPAISKMIFYKISKQSTTSATDQQLESVRYGNVAKTFSESEINKKYDYPQILIDDLGTPFARTG